MTLQMALKVGFYNIKIVLRMIEKRWAKLMLLISCLTIEEEISFTYY